MSQPFDQESVSTWIDKAKVGDSTATQKIWERYFDSLTDFARVRISEQFTAKFDGEDIAQSALFDLIIGLENGKFPELNNRVDFWRLLVCLTKRKLANRIVHETRQKRYRKESHGQAPGIEPTSDRGNRRELDNPAWQAEFTETLRHLFAALPNEQFREIAKMMIDGYSKTEIAENLSIVPRTVERKLKLIRSIWMRAFTEKS